MRKSGKLHRAVAAREVMLARPRFDLAAVAVGPAVAVRSVAVALLEELLVLAFQFAFQDDTAYVRTSLAKPLLGSLVGAIEGCVVLQFTRVPDAAVESLAPAVAAAPVITFAAMVLKNAATSLGQGDGSFTFGDRNVANEPLLFQTAHRLALIGRQIALGHDTKGASGRQCASAFAVQLVPPVSVDDELPVAIPRQLEVVGERVASVVAVLGVAVTIAFARIPVTHVDVLDVGRLVIQAAPRYVNIAVPVVIARIARSCVVQHQRHLPGDLAVTAIRM